jgi:hypothetical protein
MSLEWLAFHFMGWDDVYTYFVRTRSTGARIRPAETAAATATASEAQGYVPSTTSAAVDSPTMDPGSGTLNRAQRTPLDQFSIVFRRKEYMNVTFEPFQTPE